MKHIIIKHYESPCGELLLGAFDDRLCLCDWRYRQRRAAVDSRVQKALAASYAEGEADVLDLAIAQLEEYFQRARRDFTVPLLLAGSAFQKKVWEALRRIPYGGTLSYLQLAQALGSAAALRAVAAANGANALSLLVPCHRIIGSDGRLVGYAGGLRAKQQLLDLEREDFVLTPPW